MLKISIKQIPKEQEEEIVINCHEINDDILRIMDKLKDQSKQNTIIGFKDDKLYSVKIKDILYVEATENKTFIYCESDFYETKFKLYEIEEMLIGHSFFRCSKSIILHYSKIDCVSPAFNGRFDARLINGERVIISRQYVPELKKVLGI